MRVMTDAHLSEVDLNLLVALDALLEARNVTAAAARVGLTQPALSRALARLRATFGDPLLVRTARGMRPTPRAEALAVPLRRALGDVARLLAAPSAFDPASARREFAIAGTDFTFLVLLPRLAAALA